MTIRQHSQHAIRGHHLVIRELMRKAISMQSEAITWSSESIRGKRRSQYLWGLGAVVSTCMRGKAKGARSQYKKRRGEHLHARQGQRRTVQVYIVVTSTLMCGAIVLWNVGT